MRRIASGTILFVLLVGMSISVIQLGKSDPATIIVPDDYLTIQEAINNAENGDTVFVRNGIYNGTAVVVNKTISLIGEDKEGTIIECPDRERPFWTVGTIIIEADNVTVKEFMISNADYFGIQIKSSGCLISDNNLFENKEGIFLDGREPEATVRDNVIADNYVSENVDCGILVWASCNNQILRNTVFNNTFGIYFFLNASNNVIKQNEVIDNGDGGVVIDCYCSYNTLIYNNISYNGLVGWNLRAGVNLNFFSVGNRIVANNICNNDRGFNQHCYCDNNTIYHNNFINNIKQVLSQDSPSMNIWDNGYPSGGNYWSDYNGTDFYNGPLQNMTGNDGIGDTSLIIKNTNVDRYPLMDPYTHPLGDVNYDDQVDMEDVAIVARAFGSYPSHPNWNPIADVSKDGRVDLKDIALVAKDFGK